MHRILLVFVSFVLTHALSAQYVLINDPQDIHGALDFGQANGWGADLTSNVWTGNLVIVNDGTALPTEGCSALVNGTDIMGNFAFIDRGSCNFSLKALNAQNAGATAAVIANHTPGVGTIALGAGSFATDVTIPVVMVSYEDGQKIRQKLENGEDVNMSIGALTFDNDLGIDVGNVVAPYACAIPSHQLNSPNNFWFTPGANVVNYGAQEGSNVIVEGGIDFTPSAGGSATEVYNNLMSTSSIASGDTGFVRLADFDLTAAEMGQYTYSYNVSSDNTDEVPFDNDYSESFYVTSNVYSRARWDVANNRPMRTNAYTISGGGPIEMMTPYIFPNGTDITMDSIMFYVSTADASLANVEVTVFVYKWVDANDDGGFSADEVTVGAFAVHVFDAGFTSDEAWVTVVPEDYETGEYGYSIPGDGARLIIGTRYTGNSLVYFGFDEGVSSNQYINNVAGPEEFYNDCLLSYGQTTSFGSFGADFDQYGLFTDFWGTSSTAIYVNSNPNAIDDLTAEEAKINVYPNPASDNIFVDVDLSKQNNHSIKYEIRDMLGRTIYRKNSQNLNKETLKLNVSDLSSGQYSLTITADQGRTTVSFVVK